MRVLVVVILSILLAPALADDRPGPLSWSGEPTRQSLWRHLEVAPDPTLEAGPEEMAARANELWSPMRSEHAQMGWGRSALWARFSLEGSGHGPPHRLVLVHELTFVDSVRLFHRDAGGHWHEVLGLRDAASGWFSGARSPAFTLLLTPGTIDHFLVRTENRPLLRLPLILMDSTAFLKREQRYFLLAGALLVIPLTVAAFILLLWSIRPRREQILIVGLIVSEMVGAAWIGGMLAVAMPWSDPITLGQVGMLGWLLAVLFGFLHARTFLNLERDAPWLDSLFRWAPALLLPCLVLELTGSIYGRPLLVLLCLLWLGACLAASVWQAVRRQPYTSVYAMAWGTYFLSGWMVVASVLEWIPPNSSNMLLFAQGSIASLLFAISVVGQMRDQEVRLQDELQSSHRRFRLAAEGAAVGLFDWHVGAPDVELSATARRLIGVERHQPLDAPTLIQQIPKGPRAQLLRTIAHSIQGRRRRLGLALEIDGRRLYISGAFDYRHGRPTRFSGALSDTSELRELERSKAREIALDEFRLLFENAPIGLYRAHSDGRLLRANPEMLAMIDAQGRLGNVDTVLAPSWHRAPESFDRLMQATQERCWVVGFEYDAAHVPEVEPPRFIEYTRYAETLPNGAFIYEGAVQDISERYRLERALREANAATRKAIADRSRLFAATNHDLRQPLQSIGLFLELMAMRDLDAQSQHWIRQLRAAQLSMADTLDGLLALSRMEAGQLTPQLGPVNVNLLLDRLRSEYQPMAEAKGLTLRVAPTRVSVITDPRLLERMLRNLITNAIRYTDNGRVWVGCRRRGDNVALQVRDTGPGISEAARQIIFEAYERLDEAHHAEQGFGLGLAIVRGLSELVGAKVALRSALGRGSTFELILPLLRGPSVPVLVDSEREDLPLIDGLKVLVIDDEQMVRDALSALLRAQGGEVRSACDRAQMLATIEDGWHPDAIVLDYQLQDEIGTTLHQQLCLRLGHDLPGVVLSGEAISPTTGVGLMALRKPVSPLQLLVALRRGGIMQS